MKQAIAAFLSGVLFAVGLGFSEMTNPLKILAFLDFTGHWDPSLLWVMAGAVGVYAAGYHLFIRGLKVPRPLFSSRFQVPENKKVTTSLLIGSAIFGIGWGLAGFCPGPSLVALLSGSLWPVVFVVSMLAGMKLESLMRPGMN